MKKLFLLFIFSVIGMTLLASNNNTFRISVPQLLKKYVRTKPDIDLLEFTDSNGHKIITHEALRYFQNLLNQINAFVNSKQGVNPSLSLELHINRILDAILEKNAAHIKNNNLLRPLVIIADSYGFTQLVEALQRFNRKTRRMKPSKIENKQNKVSKSIGIETSAHASHVSDTVNQSK